MRKSALWLVLAPWAALISSSGLAVEETVPSRLEPGRKIYNFRCYYCHGYSGNGNTLAATYLDPRPRNFIDPAAERLSREAMVTAVTRGRPGTAMSSFRDLLTPEEIDTVVDFVREEFIQRKSVNTRYHLPANGWPDHERYAPAFPFATGALPLDTPDETLSSEQRAGKALFLGSCITCHDRARVTEEGPVWEPTAASYPRGTYVPQTSFPAPPPPDAMSGASLYARHDLPPVVTDLTPTQRLGERIFQENCAFCHAADGTGRNWIGSFLDPRPRNLTDPAQMAGMNAYRLAVAIRCGLPYTSMPGWREILNAEEILATMHYIHRVFHPLSDWPAATPGAPSSGGSELWTLPATLCPFDFPSVPSWQNVPGRLE